MCCILIFFISKGFLISLLISSLIHGLFRNIFSFQIFGDFPESFLLLISNLNPLWPKTILCRTWSLLNLFRLVLWPWIRSILENVLYALKRVWVLLRSGGVFCKCQSGPVADSLFKSPVPLLIFCLCVLATVVRGYCNFWLSLWICLFPLRGCSFLLHVFWQCCH